MRDQRHLATGLGGLGVVDTSKGRHPRSMCPLCGRTRRVRHSGRGAYCNDCRAQESALIAKWENEDGTDGQPEG